MNKHQILVLKSIRKAYQNIVGFEIQNKPECIQDADIASQTIYEALKSDKPCMIARFGAFELGILSNYLGIQKGKNLKNFITLKQEQWWWQESLIKSMNTNAGFFPPNKDKIEKD